MENTAYFRERLTNLGFQIVSGIHPIVPIVLGDEHKTVTMAKALNERGIFVVGFSYPVVPKGEARIRVQLSAAHTRDHLDRAIAAFADVGRELGVI
jgi:glycine C-acetyltransferase